MKVLLKIFKKNLNSIFLLRIWMKMSESCLTEYRRNDFFLRKLIPFLRSYNRLTFTNEIFIFNSINIVVVCIKYLLKSLKKKIFSIDSEMASRRVYYVSSRLFRTPDMWSGCSEINFYPGRFMTVVRKHLCTGDRNRKAGKSECFGRMFGIERSLLYLI
jgi:hypothetical protein